VTTLTVALLVAAGFQHRAAPLPTITLPSDITFDINTETLIDCGMSGRLLTLRLEPHQATLADANGILATLDGEHLTLHRASLILYANQERWRRQDLQDPSKLAKFISHVCACPRAKFTSIATGRTRWSISEFSIVKGQCHVCQCVDR
jgi:hypothetical protein